ncbi:MAG: hypothetical protein RI932_706 [Pseudomonadota bacterium]|jgi:hypothetical protein
MKFNRTVRLRFIGAWALSLLLFLSVVNLQACKPPTTQEASTAAVPACTVWPSHFMMTKGNIPVFQSVEDLEDNRGAQYVGKGTPVIRELTILNEDKDARLMKIVVRGGTLAGEKRWWTLSTNLESRTKAVCPPNTPRKCSENAVHFCDGGGCRCLDAGAAPDDEIGNMVIEGVATLGIGPVVFASRTIISSLGAIRLVGGTVKSVPTVFANGSINLTRHVASPQTLLKAEEFIAGQFSHSYQFARSMLNNPTYKNLDMIEVAAINHYTRIGYGEINAALRAADPAKLARLQPVIEAASSGLSKMVAQSFVGTVYRGVSLKPDVSALYKVGSRVTERAFTSTTRNAAEKFSGNTVFVITSKTGKMIEELSQFKGEAEVLFAPGTVFKVVSRAVEGKVTKIFMEQISP